MICHPYYRILCKKYGVDKPFLQIVVIDSTTLHFDQTQQKWLQWVVKHTEVKNNLLISHHAIGPTIGKRHLKRDESALYGSYFSGDNQFIGNQHRVLEQVCVDLDILPEIQQWIKAVAHDDILGYVEHPTSGNTIYTGGASSNDRTPSFYTLPGQEFPPLSYKNQEEENAKANTGGFAKLKIKDGKLCDAKRLFQRQMKYSITNLI